MLPERRSAEVTPAVCRASAGAVEHLAIARVKNLADWLASAKGRENLWVYGAAAGAAVSYDRPDYSGRVVLVLGSEGRGLRPRVAGDLRRADRAAEPRKRRIAQRLDRRGGARVRNLAIPQGAT